MCKDDLEADGVDDLRGSRSSDIDLTLRGYSLDWKLCAEIGGMFEASSIPYRVDVSVWDLLKHDELKDHIRRRGVVLFDRDVSDAEQAAVRAARRCGRQGGRARNEQPRKANRGQPAAVGSGTTYNLTPQPRNRKLTP